MIKAIIIDDEQHCLDRLRKLLVSFFYEEVELVGCYLDVVEAREALSLVKPDLVFLDIEMEGLTGFDLLKSLKEVDFHVVFTTAHNKYAIDAFKLSAINYLLKPIDVDDLKDTFKRIEKIESKSQSNLSLDALFQNLDTLNSQNKKIAIPTISGLCFVNLQDILRCQSDVNYTIIHKKDKSSLTVAKTLKDFESLLKDYHFFRVHNSHLINLNYIKNYNKGKGGYVTLEDGTEIEVSTRRKDDFIKCITAL